MANGIPFIPATDRFAGLRQGLQNFVGGTIQRQQQQAQTNDIQAFLASLQGGQPFQPQTPQGANLAAQFALQQQQQQGILRNTLAGQGPTSIADQRALQALRTGSRPGTSEFEEIAEGPTPPATQTQLRAKEIQRLQAIPLNKRTAAQSESLKRLLEGQSAVTIKFPSPASPSERTEIAKTNASLDALNNIKDLFDNARTRTGPIVGRLDPVLGLFNRTTEEQENFLAATSAFRNKIIEEITGAQMSEVEASRILKQVPQETDPPVRWRAKWQQSKKNLEFLQKRRREVLRQSGLRVPGGQKEIDIRGMSDEALRKLAGEE